LQNDAGSLRSPESAGRWSPDVTAEQPHSLRVRTLYEALFETLVAPSWTSDAPRPTAFGQEHSQDNRSLSS